MESQELSALIESLVIKLGVGGAAIFGTIYLGGKVLDVIKAWFESRK